MRDHEILSTVTVSSITGEIFFFKTDAENETGRLNHERTFDILKGLYEVKASCLTLTFNKIW